MIEFIPSIFQGITGIAQLIGGLAGQPERPKYNIPTAATDALRQSKRLAGQTRLPGQDISEIQMGERTANMTGSIEKLGGGGAGLGALSSIYGQEAQGRRQLLGDASRYYASNQAQLGNALNNYARYQDKEWQKNIGDKYEEEAGASSALIEGGMRNTFAGANNIFGTMAYQKLLGNRNSPTPTGGGWNQNPYYTPNQYYNYNNY